MKWTDAQEQNIDALVGALGRCSRLEIREALQRARDLYGSMPYSVSKPYKPRPVCECGAKRWVEVFHNDTKKITLECKVCGREVER